MPPSKQGNHNACEQRLDPLLGPRSVFPLEPRLIIIHQIGDLLAQISGERPADCSTSKSASSFGAAKRKPGDDLRTGVSKVRRLPPVLKKDQTIRPPPSAEHALPAKREGNSSTGGSNRQLEAHSIKHAGLDRNRTTASKPAGADGPSSRPAKATQQHPPKRGSFAEILARGKRAQAVMGQVGKIQHKKVEKGAIKKKSQENAGVKTRGNQKPGSRYPGTSKPAAGSGLKERNGSDRAASQTAGLVHAKTKATRRSPDNGIPAKRIKKAAQATTGYTGTARPKPDDCLKKKSLARGGALLNAQHSRQGSSKQSRFHDEYDEELDDFIDYDEDEEDQGQGGAYYSDASSDMEAGLDELDIEEQKAERIARREDVEQERLERSLKAAKERRRQALEALGAARRR